MGNVQPKNLKFSDFKRGAQSEHFPGFSGSKKIAIGDRYRVILLWEEQGITGSGISSNE